MGGGGVRNMLLLSLVARCLEVCCNDCMGVCGKACCVAAVVKDIFFWPWSVDVCCMFV